MHDEGAGPAVGVLGGSFDPMHLGHLVLARDALEQLGLRRILLVPALRSPLRDEPHSVDFGERVEMLRATARPRPWLEVDPVEGTLPQPSYSINTVHALRQRLPGVRLVWLIGADQLARLPQWQAAAELVRLVTFGVAARPGTRPERPDIPGLQVHFLHERNIDISSTEVRQRLAKGLPIDHLVPAEINDFIRSRGIYRKATA